VILRRQCEVNVRLDAAGNVLLLFIMLHESGEPVRGADGQLVCIGIPMNQDDTEVAAQVRALTRCLTDMETQELLAKQAVIDRATQPPVPPGPARRSRRGRRAGPAEE
jgi:hypothetical protein